MYDSRIDDLAKKLVRYSTKVKRDQNVLIDVTDVPDSIVIALIRAVRAVKANPFVNLQHAKIKRELDLGATETQYEIMGDLALAQMQHMDAYIAIRGSNNITEGSDVPAERTQLAMSKLRPTIDYRVNKTNWCVLRWPTSSMAQQAMMSTEAFEDLFFNVCLLDYEKLLPGMKALSKRMDEAEDVQITGPGTDLRFSLKGQGSRICSGTHNLPDGEVFTAPVRNSVEGFITYNAPSVYQGIAFDNVRLEFEKGKIVKATANLTKEINKIFDTDEGARYIGEFAIAFNNELSVPIRDILFDEKIGGSFHFTPGKAYEGVFGNGNESQIHWDLVQIQRKEWGGGQIIFDGEVIRKDGIFQTKDLAPLNPGGKYPGAAKGRAKSKAKAPVKAAAKSKSQTEAPATKTAVKAKTKTKAAKATKAAKTPVKTKAKPKTKAKAKKKAAKRA